MKLSKELAPKAKAKSSPAAKQRAHAKHRAHAPPAAAPAANGENVQNLFSMRRHKRKAKDGHPIFAYAIWSSQAQKQLVQLTSTAKEDAESIVERQVAALNNGETTSEEVISYLNNLKPVG